ASSNSMPIGLTFSNLKDAPIARPMFSFSALMQEAAKVSAVSCILPIWPRSTTVTKLKPVIRRLKFGDAGNFDTSFRNLSPTSQAIEPVATAYVENMERVLSLWELPVNLTVLMSKWRLAQASQREMYNNNVKTPLAECETARERRAAEKQRQLDDEYLKYPN